MPKIANHETVKKGAISNMDTRDRFTFKCPSCGICGMAALKYRGKTVGCPKCKIKISVSADGSRFTIPGTSPSNSNDDGMLNQLSNADERNIHGFIFRWAGGIEVMTINTVNEYLKYSTDVDFRGLNGMSALHCAAVGGNIEVADLLLNNEANVNLPAGDDIEPTLYQGWTPLHFACKHNHQDFVAFLMKRNADISATETHYGMTPLDLAAAHGHMEVAEVLITCGANVNCQDSAGSTPLHTAAEASHIGIVRLLLKNGADINAKTRQCATPLFFAASGGNVSIVEILLQAGADINATDIKGFGPLHAAAFNNQTAVAVLLIEHGASVDAVNHGGGTPLVCAVVKGNVEMVRLLLEHNADCTIADNNQNTPADFASKFPDGEILGIITECERQHREQVLRLKPIIKTEVSNELDSDAKPGVGMVDKNLSALSGERQRYEVLLTGYLKCRTAVQLLNNGEVHGATMTRESLSLLIDGYTKVFRCWRDQQRSVAQDFNLIHLLGLTNDENRHSDVLAWLLSKDTFDATHSQGNLGFSIFLKALNLPQNWSETKYVVIRESQHLLSRIDIEVFAQGEFLIHIEVKVAAPVGKNQLERESKDLCELAQRMSIPRSAVIAYFLTPNGCLPPNPGVFAKLSWADLIPVFKEFSIQAEAERVRWFASHYSEAIERFIMESASTEGSKNAKLLF